MSDIYFASLIGIRGICVFNARTPLQSPTTVSLSPSSHSPFFLSLLQGCGGQGPPQNGAGPLLHVLLLTRQLHLPVQVSQTELFPQMHLFPYSPVSPTFLPKCELTLFVLEYQMNSNLRCRTVDQYCCGHTCCYKDKSDEDPNLFESWYFW